MKKMQNIAIVVYSHYSRDARVRRYTESLARKGFQVDVICLKEDYKPESDNISLFLYPIPRIRSGRLWYMIEYLLFFIYSFILLLINFFSKKYKIIHINNMPEVLVFSALIPKIFGSRIILDMHDPMPELYMSKYHKGGNCLIVRLLKLLENASFRFADKIITANEAFKAIFIKRSNINSKDIAVILNCPDPNIFKTINNQQLTIDNRSFTLLYMGTVEKRFGLDIVLDAIPKLIIKIPNFKFVIIPKLEREGKYFRNLEYRIQNSELKKYVNILNPLPLERIAEYLKEADIGVVLAQNGVFTENIFPVKLLEFVQMNIPVIATKTKVLGQYFTDKQIYFLDKNTPDEFAKAVLNLYKNRRLRARFAQNAKAYLAKYNWAQEEKKYLEIIGLLATQ